MPKLIITQQRESLDRIEQAESNVAAALRNLKLRQRERAEAVRSHAQLHFGWVPGDILHEKLYGGKYVVDSYDTIAVKFPAVWIRPLTESGIPRKTGMTKLLTQDVHNYEWIGQMDLEPAELIESK